MTVPGYYYKVIYSPDKQQMIAFIMPNRKLSEPITSYIKSVDEVESLTGIDFFYDLDDVVENQLEVNSNTAVWDFGKTKVIVTPQKQVLKSVQCKGIAKSTGKRCKQMTTNSNGYCRYHQGHIQ